ncbi:MAG: pyruvate kinase [bacterium]|nr:pyruvate kinase [bacterium]
MNVKAEKIHKIIEEIDEVLTVIKKLESDHRHSIQKVHPSFKSGAKNLIHYGAFRSLNLKKLQKRLHQFGLSILDGTESHIATSLLTCRHFLLALVGEIKPAAMRQGSVKRAIKQQKKHAKDLFGYRSKGRRVRIMITLPTEAAYDYTLIRNLIASGMNIARINCAHGNPEIWMRMIQNLQRAKTELRKKCKVFMDLAGPKLRTGQITAGVTVRKFTPTRNASGEVIEPTRIKFVSDLYKLSHNDELPVDLDWMHSLVEGDRVVCKDARNKRRKFVVKQVTKDHVHAECNKTCYLKPRITLSVKSTKRTCAIGEFHGINQALILRKDDLLRVINPNLDVNSTQPSNGQETEQELPFISCTAPEIFETVQAGEKIIFDDGKIEGIILEASSLELLVKITNAKHGGSKLRADKGINLPDSNLSYTGLTAKDKIDLQFIVKHADAVNASFVQSASDITELYKELNLLDAPDHLGVVLKIENQKAYQNLSSILLEGMKRYPLGVMIARGDLAIEAGWANMPRIQNEILRWCNSAHVPTVWATQVLENMAKKGIPSRSELTDVANSLKSDCVMLNKGDYILETLHLLHSILSDMDSYRDKEVKMFEALNSR